MRLLLGEKKKRRRAEKDAEVKALAIRLGVEPMAVVVCLCGGPYVAEMDATTCPSCGRRIKNLGNAKGDGS